jgi:hypothetical protein
MLLPLSRKPDYSDPHNNDQTPGLVYQRQPSLNQNHLDSAIAQPKPYFTR